MAPAHRAAEMSVPGRHRLALADPRGTLPLLAGGLVVSLAAAATLAEPQLQRRALEAAVAAVASGVLLLAPRFPLFLALVATFPFADWKPPGLPLSISVVLALALTLRCLAELPTLRPLGSGLVLRWTALPLLLIPSAFLGPASLGSRGQFFLSVASWFAIALLVAHFVDERRWHAVRLLLIAELVLALVVGAAEIAAKRWLIPFPNPADVQAEYFFGYFRPRAIALSPYELGEFLAFTAPLVWWELGLALRRDPVRRAVLWAALAAGQLALLVATLSRKSLWQAAVSAAVFLALALRHRGLRSRILVLAAGISTIALLAVYLNGPAFETRITSTTSAQSVNARIDTLRDAIRIGVDHMPFGAGIDNFVSTSTARYGQQLAAYNSYAESFSDSGLLGLLVAVSLVTVPLAAAARARRHAAPPAPVAIPALAGLIALALVESSIWRKSLAFGAGLCIALYLNGTRASGAAR